MQNFTTIDSIESNLIKEQIEEKSDQNKIESSQPPPVSSRSHKEQKFETIERMIWEIGNIDSSNIEFDDKDCNDVKNKKSNEWKKVVNFGIGENIKCFPGMLWSKEEETAPNQICISFESQAKIDKPICLTIYFIGKKTRELSLSSSSVACFSAVIDKYPLLKTNITSDFDQQKQCYKWTEKRLLFDKNLESGFHQIILTQQKGCIKFDCLKLEELPSPFPDVIVKDNIPPKPTCPGDRTVKDFESSDTVYESYRKKEKEYLIGLSFFYKSQKRAIQLEIDELIGIENKSILARIDIKKKLLKYFYPYFFLGIDETSIGNRESDLIDLPISSYGIGTRLSVKRLSFEKGLLGINTLKSINVELAFEGRLLNNKDKSNKGGSFNFTRSIKWNEYQGKICFTSETRPEIFIGLAYSIINGTLNYNNEIFSEKIKFNEVDPLITFIGLRWRLSDFFQVIGEIRGVDMIKKEAKGPQKNNFLLGLELIF